MKLPRLAHILFQKSKNHIYWMRYLKTSRRNFKYLLWCKFNKPKLYSEISWKYALGYDCNRSTFFGFKQRTYQESCHQRRSISIDWSRFKAEHSKSCFLEKKVEIILEFCTPFLEAITKVEGDYSLISKIVVLFNELKNHLNTFLPILNAAFDCDLKDQLQTTLKKRFPIHYCANLMDPRERGEAL